MRDLISAQTQTLAWMAIFFFASAAASSAYLTVNGLSARDPRAGDRLLLCSRHRDRRYRRSLVFGVLIDTGSRGSVFAGYLLGAVLMVIAGGVAWRWAWPPSASRSKPWRGP